MNIPEFTAQASLYRTSNSYRSGSLHRVSDNQVHPADCYSDCRNPCARDCSGLVGGARGACLRACVSECRKMCLPPGPVFDPFPPFPPSPPSPPPGQNFCSFGRAYCNGKCCPIGTVCCGVFSDGQPNCKLGSTTNACLH